MNQIIEHRKLNKKEKMILTNHLIKVCRNLHWIETDSDKAVFITEPFLGYSSISHLKHIITMFYIIRSRIDITSSDEDIRNALYHYQSINRVIEILLKEGGTYRIETIRYREELWSFSSQRTCLSL